MLSGRPLLDNRADTALFTGRELELSMLCSALEHQFNCLVVGDAGMGKTTLLRALMYRARNHVDEPGLIGNYAITYVRAEGITAGAELLDRIA
jgi:GTPase SAR1 family protein